MNGDDSDEERFEPRKTPEQLRAKKILTLTDPNYPQEPPSEGQEAQPPSEGQEAQPPSRRHARQGRQPRRRTQPERTPWEPPNVESTCSYTAVSSDATSLQVPLTVLARKLTENDVFSKASCSMCTEDATASHMLNDEEEEDYSNLTSLAAEYDPAEQNLLVYRLQREVTQLRQELRANQWRLGEGGASGGYPNGFALSPRGSLRKAHGYPLDSNSTNRFYPDPGDEPLLPSVSSDLRELSRLRRRSCNIDPPASCSSLGSSSEDPPCLDPSCSRDEETRTTRTLSSSDEGTSVRSPDPPSSPKIETEGPTETSKHQSDEGQDKDNTCSLQDSSVRETEEGHCPDPPVETEESSARGSIRVDVASQWSSPTPWLNPSTRAGPGARVTSPRHQVESVEEASLAASLDPPSEGIEDPTQARAMGGALPCERSPDPPVERKIASTHDVGVLWTLTEVEEEDDSQQSSPLPHVNRGSILERVQRPDPPLQSAMDGTGHYSASLPGGHAGAVPNTNPGQVPWRGRVPPGERKPPPPAGPNAVAGHRRSIGELYPRIPVDPTEMKRAVWESGGSSQQKLERQMRNVGAQYPRIPVDPAEMKRAAWESGGGSQQEAGTISEGHHQASETNRESMTVWEMKMAALENRGGSQQGEGTIPAGNSQASETDRESTEMKLPASETFRGSATSNQCVPETYCERQLVPSASGELDDERKPKAADGSLPRPVTKEDTGRPIDTFLADPNRFNPDQLMRKVPLPSTDQEILRIRGPRREDGPGAFPVPGNDRSYRIPGGLEGSRTVTVSSNEATSNPSESSEPHNPIPDQLRPATPIHPPIPDHLRPATPLPYHVRCRRPGAHRMRGLDYTAETSSDIADDDATEDEGSNGATPQAAGPQVHDFIHDDALAASLLYEESENRMRQELPLTASLVDEESENRMRQELTTGLEELRRLRTELRGQIVQAEEVCLEPPTSVGDMEPANVDEVPSQRRRNRWWPRFGGKRDRRKKSSK